MKRLFLVFLAICLSIAVFSGCTNVPEEVAANPEDIVEEVAANPEDVVEEAAEDVAEVAVVEQKDQTYILVCALSTLDMFNSNDFVAFEQWGKDRGVKTEIFGPTDWDMAAFAAAIDQAAAKKPDGLLIAGFDPTLKPAIDNAMAQGIPVVLYDSDVPESDRIAFCGTDWAEVGRIQAEHLGEALGGEGKVAYMGIVGMSIMEKAFDAFEETMAEKYPNIVLMDAFDNQASVEEAASTFSDIISANPDLKGIACFASNVAPGAGIAIKEANKVGEIVITSVDIEPQHIQLVEDGIAVALVGQKRKLFTYYGAQMLYDIVNKSVSFTSDDAAGGITTVPAIIDTGVIVVTKENVQFFAE